MKYETLNEALEAMAAFQQTKAAFDHAMGMLSVDAVTVAPSDSGEGRGRTMGVLSRLSYDLETDPAVARWLSVLEANRESLTPIQRRQAEVIRKNFEKTNRIPAEEYVAYNILLNDAQDTWEKAKNRDDFDSFAPYLEKIVAYNRKLAAYYDPTVAPYDALLNEYEEGMTMETLDAFFSRLRAAIVPLVNKVQAAEQIDDSFLRQEFPIEGQKQFSEFLMDLLGLDRRYCAIAESEHPFTHNNNNKDVRITTHYHADNLTFSMFSVIHEGGHALYELGTDDCYNYTVLSGGVSMGIHESQSRFYENILGRSAAFIHVIFPKLKELFPKQLENVDEQMFYRAVNRSQPSLIRTEADELTYASHVMVRYEIEKQLIAGTLAVQDVPAEWNRLYREYLGIDVPNNRQGCLQDSHWSGGAIGYFPSYALGSAYGAQMLSRMREDLGDIFADVEKGDLSRITAWLREHIHRHAGFKKPVELFEEVCGKFDAKYYTDYLTEKYTGLYGL